MATPTSKPVPLRPACLRDVCKRAVAIVAKKVVRVLRRRFLQSRDIGAVGEEDVGAAIAVVVEDSNAAGHGFGDIFGGALAAVEAKWQLLKFESDGSGGLVPKWPFAGLGEAE